MTFHSPGLYLLLSCSGYPTGNSSNSRESFSNPDNMEKWYHTIQDWHRFTDSVIDLIDEYVRFSTEIDPDDGIYVDEDDNIRLIARNEAPDESDFHPIVNLLDLTQSPPELKYDAVEELVDKYIFVR